MKSKWADYPKPEVGQVWIDNDSRGSGNRRLRIVRIEGDKAVCASVIGSSVTKIRLSRFVPNSTGYRLASFEVK